MKYTYLDIKNSYPKEKEKLESLYGRIIPVRKISFLLTRIIINTNILPWHISVVSIGIAILGCILIGINNKILQISHLHFRRWLKPAFIIFIYILSSSHSGRPPPPASTAR